MFFFVTKCFFSFLSDNFPIYKLNCILHNTQTLICSASGPNCSSLKNLKITNKLKTNNYNFSEVERRDEEQERRWKREYGRRNRRRR